MIPLITIATLAALFMFYKVVIVPKQKSKTIVKPYSKDKMQDDFDALSYQIKKTYKPEDLIRCANSINLFWQKYKKDGLHYYHWLGDLLASQERKVLV